MNKLSLAVMLTLAVLVVFASDQRIIRVYLEGLQGRGGVTQQQSSVFQSESYGKTLIMGVSENSTTFAKEEKKMMELFPSSIQKPPTMLFFPKKHIRFLHMGKAGGGTIAGRIRTDWKVQIRQCHPFPCIDSKWKESNNQRHPLLLFGVRDPIDRFVSAWYWRILRLCHPEVDKRPPQNERPDSLRKKPCISDDGRNFANESSILFYRYNQNASLLAEDLCSSNETIARIARESLATIWHAKDGITDWLDFNWNASRMFVYVVEANAEDLEQQVDNSMHWFFNVSKFQGDEAFARRMAFAQQRKQPEGKHSSHTIQQPLSSKGEKCLEQFYRQDYQILKKLSDTACKTTGCRNAISSILERRKGALEVGPV